MPTHDRKSPARPAAPPESMLRARMRAFQESETNARIWQLITHARELREGVLELRAWLKGRDPVEEVLLEFGVVPPGPGADFASNTFAAAVEGLAKIASAIGDEVGLICGELPPPPLAVCKSIA